MCLDLELQILVLEDVSSEWNNDRIGLDPRGTFYKDQY